MSKQNSRSQLLGGDPSEEGGFVIHETYLPSINQYELGDNFNEYFDPVSDDPVAPASGVTSSRKGKDNGKPGKSKKGNSYDMSAWGDVGSNTAMHSKPLPRGLLQQYETAFPTDPHAKSGETDDNIITTKGGNSRLRWVLLVFIVLLVAAGVAVVLMTSSGSDSSPNDASERDPNKGSSVVNPVSGSEEPETSSAIPTYTAVSRFIDVDYDHLIPNPEAKAEIIETLKLAFAQHAGVDVAKIISVDLSRGSVVVTLTVADVTSKEKIDALPTFCTNTRANSFNFDLCVNPIQPQPSTTHACQALPCKNNARCMATSTGAICGCADGWTGEVCDKYGSMPSGITAVLPNSAPGQLLRLVKDCGNANLGLARSFNEKPWEPILPGLPGRVNLSCAAECTVTLPRDGSTFCIKEVDVSHVPTSPDAKAARLLSQATFGATRGDIQHVKDTLNGDAEAWVVEQQALPATYLRQYYRARSNPKHLADDGFRSVRSACEPGSRWHSYAFGMLDEGKTLKVLNGSVTSGWFAMYLDGVLLTEIETFDLGAEMYTICEVVSERRGLSSSTVKLSSDNCGSTSTINNPRIHFESVNPNVIDFSTATLNPHATHPDVVFLHASVSTCTGNVFERSTIMYSGLGYYRHDPRVKMLENTLDNPADVSSTSDTCPSVVETFLNEASCVRRPSCSQPVYESVLVPLNNETMRTWYKESSKYVYYIKGLRLEDPYRVSPCKSATSRWLRTAGNCSNPTTTMDPETLVTLATALGDSTDENPFVRNIQLSGAKCLDTPATIGAQIDVRGECFEHVHPQLYDVRDFSNWVLRHDGNAAAFAANRPNPIAQWAVDGLTYLEYPSDHPMSRFSDRLKFIPLVGRYGDSVDFEELATELQTLEVANFVGANVYVPDSGFEACGSPEETANEPSSGNWYPSNNPLPDQFNLGQLDWAVRDMYTTKSMVWNNVAFSANDQLRQRVAWVLSQILVVSDTSTDSPNIEMWMTYYDIFVKHAFGSYRDILQEVTYSPMMGNYLTYLQNKGFASSGNRPDENFAREIMQLFTIGLWKLGDDGVPLFDERGEQIPTYDNDDIVSFARVWTGFDRQAMRPNIEGSATTLNMIDPMQIKAGWRDPLPKTKLDAGYIGDGYPSCHELPPQHFLREGATFDFLGSTSIEGPKFDPYSELPDEIFRARTARRKGGRWFGIAFEFRNRQTDYIEYTIERDVAESVDLRAYYYVNGNFIRHFNLTVNGEVVEDRWAFPTSSSNFRLRSNLPVKIDLVAGVNKIRISANGDEDVRLVYLAFGGDGAIRKRLTPNPATSELHAALCAAPSVGAACTFPRKVTLPRNLACDGDECFAGRVIVIRVNDPVKNIQRFYRYRPRECVRFPVFQNGHKTFSDRVKRTQCSADYMEASTRCCTTGTNNNMNYNPFAQECLYANEAMTYEVAEARCAARGGSLCTGYGYPYLHTACAEDMFQWTTRTCQPKLEVYPNGYIGLIDPIAGDSSMWEYMESSRHTFRIYWEDATAIPRAAKGCGAGCEVVEVNTGDTCVCSYNVTTTVGFGNSSIVPSVDEIASTLFIGSLPPSTYDAGMYVKCSEASFCTDDVAVWTLASNPMEWNTNTIFELPPRLNGGAKRYLTNKVSMVTIRGQPDASFRSPPSFLPSLGEQQIWGLQTYLSTALFTHEAEYEVAATIDHLFEHPNTGPFVALRLIQQMVTSNPSPMYVEHVVSAFKTGKYGDIGSGKYGDLGATVAAVLLDPEARTSQYDAEPTFGHGHEPVIKILSILRAFEWKPSHGQQLGIFNLDGKVGMEAFNSPSVFGFYQPDFVAEGSVANAQVVSPEMSLLEPPYIIAYLNAMVSLIDKGMSSCSDGFGSYCWDNDKALGYEGFLTAPPTAVTGDEVADELALLLTQDRMHPAARKVISDAYNLKKEANGPESALKYAQKLALSAPDFHTSTINSMTDREQKSTGVIESQGRKFKAIVVVLQNGGCDSWNVLVPKGKCINDHDYYSEYAEVRTPGGIPRDDLLDIEVTNGTQPCAHFGVHSSLPLFKRLHDSKEGAFVTNIGALVEPLTKADYQAKSKRMPPSLFAHNAGKKALATVDADNVAAKGVLGRTVQALLDQDVPYKTELFSVTGNQRILGGSDQRFDIVSRNSGLKQFNQYKQLSEDLFKLTANTSESVFSDTYSTLLRQSLSKTNALGSALDKTKLKTKFGTDGTSKQLKQVAKLIKLRETLETERAVYVVSRAGFDSHFTFDISKPLKDINNGLTSFVSEMKEQGIWEDVVFFTVSDFGRKLRSNGRGSDHAWGGNHFVGGGSINGGEILGKFPDTLQSDGDLNIGNGRLIPTLPWEGIWEGIVEWFGVEKSQMSTVLPNLANFGPEQRYNAAELFVDRSPPTTINHAVQWAVPTTPRAITVKPGDGVIFTWDGYHDLVENVGSECDFSGSIEVAAGTVGGSHLWMPLAATLEAEQAAVVSGAVVYSQLYVEFQASGNFIEFDHKATRAGTVMLSAAYYNGDGITKTFELSVNGVVIESAWSFPAAGSWDTRMATSEVAITLDEGSNVIRITGKSSLGIRLDSISYGLGEYNLACSVGDHCVNGMQIQVIVAP